MTPEEKSKNLIGLFSGWHNEDTQMQRVLAARAAAGLLDSDAAAATMTEARQSIAANVDAMTQDFSAANDAALFADQYDD